MEAMDARKDVLKAIKKLASEAMMEGLDEDEALVAEVDMRTVDKDEAEDMMEDAMEGEMPELGEEEVEVGLDEDEMIEDEEDEDELMMKALQSKLGL